MTPAEIRAVREHLGLSHTELAAVLAVDARSVRRWEMGTQDIHEDNVAAIRRIVDITATTVRRQVIALRGKHEPTIVTYRYDADMWDAYPKYAPLPARWHHIIAARVAEHVPGLVITYQPVANP